ncbi:TIGR02444 family protein [Pseudomonas sp. PSKL.D1]|uniref:TIGR02444 family protein n=1 Tax=Pseudomonas sp. PSKL.D1 TaxID=3029060 RepID=UPI002380EF9D|nr:TIGR02444 family protein [Pseudomonas sp. PSKL.D1]WDY60679.1 TIGR02444 family protein [Pseudomonas sp. PSKL.D1]
MHTDLWNYALALYTRPGVEEACLSLQAQGCDVCMLLCATWLQGRGVAPTRDRIQALQTLAAPWQQEVVSMLRHLRQQWRAQAQQDPQLAALREQVKGLELQAEKLLLQRLEACAQAWPSGAGEADWLTLLTPEHARGHDALNQLRVAAAGLQEAEDGA